MRIIIRTVAHAANDYTNSSVSGSLAWALAAVFYRIAISIEGFDEVGIEFIIIENDLSFYLVFLFFQVSK